jgi:thioredoxin 2
MVDTQIVRCPSCGANNRVPGEKLAQGLEPVCGRCKTPLPQSDGHPIEVSDSTFASMVERSPIPVLLDLWAPWCGPCRMMTPILDELASKMAGKIRFAKLNVDENPMTAQRFDARNIPLMVVLQNGREVDRMIGAQTMAEIMRHLAAFTRNG